MGRSVRFDPGHLSIPYYVRFLPFLEPKHIKYELHLFAENVNAPASRVGELILSKAEQLDPVLVATAAHNKVGLRSWSPQWLPALLHGLRFVWASG